VEFRTGIDMIMEGNYLLSLARDNTVTEKKSAVFEGLMTFTVQQDLVRKRREERELEV
jgi:hypothetical protein